MNKLLAAVVASTFALGSASVFAADAAKTTELTKEERIEMRNRADKLTAERAATPIATKAQAQPAPRVKKHRTTKSKKSPAADAKQIQPRT